MTDYCAASDVKNNVKGLTVSGTSAITTDSLADIISQESAVIDQYIRPRYTLPISDATSLLWLKKICIDLCVYRIAKILQPKVSAPLPQDAGQDISHVTAYREAMNMLKNVMNGKMTLPGETEKSLTFFSSGAVNRADPMAFDFTNEDGKSDITKDLW